jgi:hypothetical protein
MLHRQEPKDHKLANKLQQLGKLKLKKFKKQLMIN